MNVLVEDHNANILCVPFHLVSSCSNLKSKCVKNYCWMFVQCGNGKWWVIVVPSCWCDPAYVCVLYWLFQKMISWWDNLARLGGMFLVMQSNPILLLAAALASSLLRMFTRLGIYRRVIFLPCSWFSSLRGLLLSVSGCLWDNFSWVCKAHKESVKIYMEWWDNLVLF